MEQHQISGGSVGNALAKRNNTKSVDRRRMRRRNGTTPNRWIGGKYAGQTEQHQIGGTAANAPAKRKRMRRGDEMRRPNSNTKSVGRRRMRRRNGRECGAAMGCASRTKKRRRGDGMHRPKEKEEVLENGRMRMMSPY
jgi:hypothetical protein